MNLFRRILGYERPPYPSRAVDPENERLAGFLQSCAKEAHEAGNISRANCFSRAAARLWIDRPVYWMERARAVEQRNRELEQEILRLRGCRPLSDADVSAHNVRIAAQEGR